MKGLLHNTFWAGWIAAISMISAVQDFMGKEMYIQHLEDHWISISWLVTSAVFVVMVICYYRYKKRGQRFVQGLLMGKSEDFAWKDSKKKSA